MFVCFNIVDYRYSIKQHNHNIFTYPVMKTKDQE